MKILILGSGGREHAIAVKLRQSPRLGDLWVTHPENPGLSRLGHPVDVPVNIREIYRLQQFCEKKKIGLRGEHDAKIEPPTLPSRKRRDRPREILVRKPEIVREHRH